MFTLCSKQARYLMLLTAIFLGPIPFCSAQSPEAHGDGPPLG